MPAPCLYLAGVSTEDELILQLCRTGNADVPEAGSVDWDALIETALQQRVAPIVFAGLGASVLEDDVAERVQGEERTEFLATALRKGAIRACLAELCERLHGAGIDFILLKGFTLDFDGRRPFQDLDLLIRERDLARTMALLAGDGYREVGDQLNRHVRESEKGNYPRQLAWNNQFLLRDEERGVLVELHTNLFERRRVHYLDLDQLLARVDVLFEARVHDEELRCDTLPAELQLVTTALYASIKRSPTTGHFRLRAYVDIERLIERGVRWDLVLEHTRAFGVAPHLSYAFEMARRLLKTSVPSDVLRTLDGELGARERIAVRWHLRSFCSLRESSLIWSKLYLLATPFLLGSRWSDRLRCTLLLPVLFPPRWKMAAHYGLAEKSPMVYLTYLVNPFRQAALAVVRLRARG